MKMKFGAFTLIAVMSCGAAWAQDNPFAGQMPVKAELKKAISSRDKIGAEFTAATTQEITLGSTKLPRGTILVGHIVDATKHTKDTPNGSVTVVFDTVKPKKGDPIAITSSLYEILPAEDSMQRADVASLRSGPGAGATANSEANANAAVREGIDSNSKVISGLVSPSSAPIKVVSAVPGVALSAVAGSAKSGVMAARNSDVDLLAGINLVIGIMPVSK